MISKSVMSELQMKIARKRLHHGNTTHVFGFLIEVYFHANPYFYFNPKKDSIIKQVVIASELKMMFNMLLLILITLLKMTLSNPQFMTERNSGHIFRLQILLMQ